MPEKLFFSPVAGLSYIVAASWLLVRLSGTPCTPLSLLGNLSFIGGVEVLASLVVCLGVTVVACTIPAHVLGMSTALLYVGSAIIVALAAMAMAAISGSDEI